MKKGIIAFLAVLLFAGAVYAEGEPAEVNEAIEVHQSWEIANDLHFEVYPNEDWVYILDWKMQILNSPPYTFTVDSVFNSDGNLRKLRFDVKFDDYIYYCDWIVIDVWLLLSEYNAIIIDNIYWTLDGEILNEEGGEDHPGQGFSVDNISDEGRSTLWFRNEGPEILSIEDFRLAINQPGPIPAPDLFEFQEWTDKIDPFVVEPGEAFTIPLEGMEPGMFLFIGWEAFELGDGTDGDEFVGSGAGVHQDQLGALQAGVEESGLLDKVKFLDVAAYPGRTHIRYYLPKSTHATVTVYSVTGEKVVTLVDEEQSAGGHTLEWDGTDARGQKTATGVYLCRLYADGVYAQEKMIRVK